MKTDGLPAGFPRSGRIKPRGNRERRRFANRRARRFPGGAGIKCGKCGDSMSMEAIRKVTEIEEQSRAEKAEAEARVKKALTEAEREGSAQLQKARREAAEKGKELLRLAEERAAKAAADTARHAASESAALRREAKRRLDQAAEMIVGRVVKS